MRPPIAAIAILTLAGGAIAAPAVDGGTYYLLPDQAGQQIQLHVTSDPAVDVQGFELYCQIDDGCGAAGPTFEAADILNGTIFDGNNPGLFPGSYVQSGRLYQGVVTSSGTVEANGLLATLTISTAGITNGQYDLFLHNDLESAETNFAGVAIDLTDAVLIVPPITGDAQLDGDVDEDDLNVLLANFGTSSGAQWTDGDFNDDAAVDDYDLSLLLAHYDQEPGGTVPAPAAAVLLLAAAPAVLRRRRSRRA